ncbi:hypothetical protein E2P65_03635, partial [Candidatus Bathyarchaeota archaeon]
MMTWRGCPRWDLSIGSSGQPRGRSSSGSSSGRRGQSSPSRFGRSSGGRGVDRGLYTGILISGTGGQGIIAAGEFLTEALFRAGREVMFTRSYGSEARGGSCRSEVIVSDSEIYDLQLDKADIL